MTDRKIDVRKKSRRKPKSRPPRNHWRSLNDTQLEYWVYIYAQAQEHDGLYSENGKDAGALFRQSQPTMSRWSDRLVEVGAARWERKKERSKEDGSYLSNILKPTAPPYAVRNIVQQNALRQNASLFNMNMDKPAENKATSPVLIHGTEAEQPICNLHDRAVNIRTNVQRSDLYGERAVSVCKVNMDSPPENQVLENQIPGSKRNRAQIAQELKDAEKKLFTYQGEPPEEMWEHVRQLKKELDGAK